MNNKKYTSIVMVAALVGSLAVVSPLFAKDDLHVGLGINASEQDNTNEGALSANEGIDSAQKNGDWARGAENDSENKMDSNLVAKVTAINGNVLTVTSQKGSDDGDNATPATYTVDITNAKLVRGNAAIAASDIAIGDTIIVQGTMTGTNFVATMVRDGKVGNGNDGDNNQALLQIQGNGQPVVAGTVQAINGSSITIVTSGAVTYTIDATNAKIFQGKNSILVAGMKVGDSIIAQGTVNGTAVVASTMIDTNATVQSHHGFFHSIGSFFKHLFGF